MVQIHLVQTCSAVFCSASMMKASKKLADCYREELAAAADFLRVLEGVKLWPVSDHQMNGKQAAAKPQQEQDVNKQLSLLKMLLRSEVKRLQARISHLDLLAKNAIANKLPWLKAFCWLLCLEETLHAFLSASKGSKARQTMWRVYVYLQYRKV